MSSPLISLVVRSPKNVVAKAICATSAIESQQMRTISQTADKVPNVKKPWTTTQPNHQFSISDRGFMPAHNPLRKLPSPYEDVEEIVSNMAFNLPDGTKGLLGRYDLGRHIHEIRLHDVSNTNDPVLDAALFRDYSILAAAYLLEPAHIHMLATNEYGRGRDVLPANVAIPLHTLANKLKIHPILDYAHGYSLNNWYLEDDAAGFTLENMRTIRQFLGGKDEAGFILVHAAMVAQTPNLVAAQQNGVAAARANDVVGLEHALKTHAATLENIMNIFGRMWQVSRPEEYLKFRTFIMGQIGNENIFPNGVIFDGVSDKPLAFRGETGAQDSIIPSCDNFLQLSTRYPKNQLTDYLKDLRYYRPADHRSYLLWLEGAAADSSVSRVALSNSKSALALLTNLECIQKFRSMHWTMTKKYIIERTRHPVATGGTPITTWLPNNLLATLEYMEEVQDVLVKHLVDDSSSLSSAERDEFESISAHIHARNNRIRTEVSQMQGDFKKANKPQEIDEFTRRSHA
eukprot:m.331236 g.331236  ORF g.331236 m.331236 type:complete len:516 (-) comp16680_c0_seq1:160-1707(-)